jgi:hypothetical protein
MDFIDVYCKGKNDYGWVKMTEYALVLYFDNETTARFQSLIGIAENACGNNYMTKPAVIPPHVTICYFKTERIDSVMPMLESKLGRYGKTGYLFQNRQPH